MANAGTVGDKGACWMVEMPQEMIVDRLYGSAAMLFRATSLCFRPASHLG
jgi:hypothetical protein